MATPLSANLHTRHIDEGYFNWTRSELPVIRFGQEVRSHFLGHTGHVGIKSLYWPLLGRLNAAREKLRQLQ